MLGFEMFGMLESEFKRRAIQEIQERFSHLDLDFIEPKIHNRSLPDVVILGPIKWAVLEFKRNQYESKRPNQEFHISRLNEKGYATFVYPENLEGVLGDLEELFTS